jgi:rSAM/selenodomain-associated transferase 1
MVKYPEKGKVKVRLSRETDEPFAVGLYRNFVLDMISMLEQSGIPFVVCFDPTDAVERFKDWLGSEYEYLAQRGGDLGERLSNGFSDAFDMGVENAIVMGSDIPDLPGNMLLEACVALETNDAVIGPSPDGGYYLIGFQQTAFLPSVFEGISWSMETVFSKTVEKLRGGGCRYHTLPSWADIDTLRDLENLAERSVGSTFNSSKTMIYLSQHREMLGEKFLG